MSGGTSADTILTGVSLWTGAGGPPGASLPDHAVALRKGRVLATGPADQVVNLEGPETTTLELPGRFVAPGFVDAHLHLMAGGLGLFRVDLRGASSPDEFVRRVRERAGDLPAGTWVLGGDWSEEDWGGRLPARGWLDRAAPEHPVVLHRKDLHTAVANSRALALAGIDRGTPDPENGVIDRDPDTGEPTGILREQALLLVRRVVPDPSPGQRRAALRAAAARALAAGITQAHDMGGVQSAEESWVSLDLLRGLHAEGELPLRVCAALPLADHVRIAELVREEGRGDARLSWGLAKAFVDGSLGSHTAWFHEPYRTGEGVGMPISDLRGLRADLERTVAAGLRPAVHAIGDRAVDWLLDAWEALGGDGTLRIEHVQHLSSGAPSRLGAPGMILSVQPYHLVDDAGPAAERLGPEREARSFAFASMIRAGARLAFGSDWPVAPLDPLAALHAAVARIPRGADPGAPWVPDERVRPEEALAAHTLGAAGAGLLGGETGILEAGRAADLVVLTADPLRIEPGEWPDRLRVLMTWVEGSPVYRSDEAT